MNRYFTNIRLAVIAVLLIVFSSVILVAYPSGYTGRTLKTSTAGCGNCHAHNPAVIGTVTGPDTVNIGQTVTYNITISDPARNKAGLDIAARTGTLGVGPSGSNIKIVGDELTHSHAINMTNHTITVAFSYTAPAAPGIDTIFATVTSGTSAWEWAPSKRIIIRNLVGIQNNNSAPGSFKLNQNYPNPFNPITNITFELTKNTELKLIIYDIIGNEVCTVLDSKLERGAYNIKWDGSDYASGIYFYKLVTADFEMTRKMILTK